MVSQGGPQNRDRHGAPGNRCCGRNSRRNAADSRASAKTRQGSLKERSFTLTYHNRKAHGVQPEGFQESSVPMDGYAANCHISIFKLSPSFLLTPRAAEGS